MSFSLLSNLQQRRSLIRCLTQSLLYLYLINTQILASTNIVWISDELSNGVFQSSIEEWGSQGSFKCQSESTLLVKSKSKQNSESLTIQKTYQSLPPHAFVILQLQVFQLDEYNESEGFQIQIDNQISSLLRYTTVSQQNICGDPRVDQIYTERFGVTHSANNLTLAISATLSSSNRILAINNLKLGVIPCEKTCASCKLLSTPSANLTDLFCLSCPENANFQQNTNSCACGADYLPNFDSGYLTCVKKLIKIVEISAACQSLISEYSTRSRVIPNCKILFDNVLQQKYVQAIINTYQFFPVISTECQSQIRYDIEQYNNQTQVYIPINRKYIRNQVQGEIFEMNFLVTDIPILSNYNYIDSSKSQLYSEIWLQMKYYFGGNVTRVHKFKINYKTYRLEYYVTAFNQDYNKNQNFITLNSNKNSQILIDEYNLELKKYLCSDKSCQYTRTNTAYQYLEEVIIRIQFTTMPNNRYLSLQSCNIFVDNNFLDIMPQVKVIDSNQGYITLLFLQMQQYIPIAQSTYNIVYLQISVSYQDNNKKQRMGQVTQIYYSAKPN